MTSRFGKTYSRRGGEGTSKFDEVVSNKKATLSTKWGQTTYKAKVNSKRPLPKPEPDELPKRPRLSDDSSEDPFGFDSDEESSKPKQVTSRAKASPAKPAWPEPPRAERPGLSLEATSSRSSKQTSVLASVSSRGATGVGSNRSQLRVVEDTARFFNTSTTAMPQENWSSMVVPQDSWSNIVAPQKNWSNMVAPQDSWSSIVAPQENCSNKVVPQENWSNKVAPQENWSSKVAPQENWSNKVAPQENWSNKVAPQENWSNKVAPQENWSNKVAPQENWSNKVAPQENWSNKVAPQENWSNKVVPQESWSSKAEAASEKQHSYSWYRNASESDKKPLAQTTTLRTEAKEPYDSWDAVMGLRSTSPTPEPPRNPPSRPIWASSAGAGAGVAGGPGVYALVLSRERERERGLELRREDKPSPPEQTPSGSEGVGEGDWEVPSEPLDHSQSVLRASNCRTYRRPNKQGKDSAGAGTSNAVAPAKLDSTEPAKNSGRGRTRDFTVLHPSSLSMCNVTIQDSLDRSMEELANNASANANTAAPGPAGDLGEAGRLRKKIETAAAKPTRFKPTKSTAKKDTKLEHFGFDQKEAPLEEGAGDPDAGATKYKINYFGFNDMSDSDGDEDDSRVRRKAKRGAMAPGAESPPQPANQESQEEDCGRVDDTEQSPPRTRLDILEFLEEEMELEEEVSPVVSVVHRGPPGGKPAEPGQQRRKIFSAAKKSPTKAVYNARHWNRPEECEEDLPPPPATARSKTQPAGQSGPSKDTNSHKDDELFKAPPPPPKVIKSVTIPTEPYQDIVTALKCRKEHKELYTVVQHVKHFNDVVEFGENQEFTDDFEYLATGLKTGQPLNTRCLCVISLAARCALPGFRMHLRAAGKVAQVFKTLNDAPHHPNLSLCTASLMYILSRDRLNMDLDRASLELMIRLLELDLDHSSSDTQLSSRDMNKVKEKIRKLCDTVHNKHLDLENITTGHLAMETLLSLTSKRAGDWFKEELRLLGGLDHIVDKVKECVENLGEEDDKEKLVASLWGAERCLRVLESVTARNPENQGYLIAYKDSSLIVFAAKALRHCEEMIQRYSREVNSSVLPRANHSNVGKAVEDCMRAIIGVLLNLTHDNEWGSTKTGEQEDLIITNLNCVLKVPQYLPAEQRFDVRVLGLGLLINLVEYSARNRHCLMEMEMDAGAPFDSVLLAPQEELQTEGSQSAIAALVQLFMQRERAAVLAEAQTDDFIKDAPKAVLDQSGEWQETGGEIQWVQRDPAEQQSQENNQENDNADGKEKAKKDEEDQELDLTKALQHAGKHMEDSIVASYTALLLGCLCQGSPINVTTVRENLPKGDFSILTEMLKKFLSFMNLTCDVETRGQKPISRVIDYLEHC